MVVLSGCATGDPRMLAVDEDAYRLVLWASQCEPEPPRDLIEQMLEPANRPPGLRGVERDVLLPSRAECLERLKQWVDDMLAELREDAERVWTEVEAPELARRTGLAGLIRDAHVEARIHRASNKYRAMYYKAHNALEAIRKREAAEAKEARKADRADPGDRTMVRLPRVVPVHLRGCDRSPDRPPRARAGPWPRPWLWLWPSPSPSPKPHGWGPRCRRRGSRPDPETNPALRR